MQTSFSENAHGPNIKARKGNKIVYSDHIP